MYRNLFPVLTLFILFFSGCVKTEPPENPFRKPIIYPIGKSPSHLHSTDLNQDGVLDLITANTDDQSVSILFGKNDGSFPNIKHLKAGRQPRWVVSGDFDEDGKVDLVVINNDENNLYIFLNQGGIDFKKTASYDTGLSPYSATVNDFNRDQHLDLAVVSRSDRFVVFLGKGDGTFIQGMVGDPGAFPIGIISEDFDSDSIIDLAISNSGSYSSDFIIFKGKGDGTFSKGNSYKTGMNPVGLIAEDFNLDDRLDMLVLNGMGDSMTLFLHTDQESFLKLKDMGAEGAPTSAAAADFNRDGHIDLVVANSRSHNVSFLSGKGEGHFHHPPLNIFTGMSPFFLLTEDFNQDGLPDLAVVNKEDHTLSVLHGRWLPKKAAATKETS